MKTLRQSPTTGRTAALLAAVSFATVLPCAANEIVGSIESNFNGTDISGDAHIWFVGHLKELKYNGTPDPEVTLYVRNSRVTLDDNGTTRSVQLPDLEMTFSDTATSDSGSFANGKWVVTVPKSQTKDAFLGGWMAPVPDGGIEGGASPVTWTADFSVAGAEVSELKWQWSAAVYEQAPADPNDLGILWVKGERSAGTPMNNRDYVTGGARGGGGSNWTGSWSSTKSVENMPNIFNLEPSNSQSPPSGPPTGELIIAENVVLQNMVIPVGYEITRPVANWTFGFQE
ncbi:MAG: hypothetical protein HKN82_19155 [Akkermansiaceae bacterium]|nr:hypothetical protein [Akkermansiaceae bacterium]NNM30496.1 hypothetical protein [Akkermansiaceae bacterium]